MQRWAKIQLLRNFDMSVTNCLKPWTSIDYGIIFQKNFNVLLTLRDKRWSSTISSQGGKSIGNCGWYPLHSPTIIRSVMVGESDMHREHEIALFCHFTTFYILRRQFSLKIWFWLFSYNQNQYVINQVNNIFMFSVQCFVNKMCLFHLFFHVLYCTIQMRTSHGWNFSVVYPLHNCYRLF